FRFLRLFGHGHRCVAPVWNHVAAEFQLSVSGNQHHRLLAALAHDTVALPARLSVLRAWRQSPRTRAAVPEPPDHDVARWPVARRRLDVRNLGRPARLLSDRQPGLAGTA